MYEYCQNMARLTCQIEISDAGTGSDYACDCSVGKTEINIDPAQE